MSIPKFPEIDPEMTRERALNMILASIAMEELAFSHIINAEGEKLQYVLGTLEPSSCREAHDVDELLRVNESVTNLLEMVSQNQMLLKNKMDKVLQSFPCEQPCHDCKTVVYTGSRGEQGLTGRQGEKCPFDPACNCCSCRCSAVFKGAYKCETWKPGFSIPWNNGNVQGQCIHRDSCNHEKILICSKGRYIVSLMVNVKVKSSCPCNIKVSLQMCNSQHCSDLFIFKNNILYNTIATISMSGVIADTSNHTNLNNTNHTNHTGTSYLRVNLLSPDTLIIEDAILNVAEL